MGETFSRRQRLRTLVGEHVAVLLFYALLSVAFSWPAVRDFSTVLAGAGPDMLHDVGFLWHVKEAVLGREALFWMSRIYYPLGISTLVHSSGTTVGLLGLPFAWLGPIAAYNGALLLSLALTGFCMYLFARSLALGRAEALFAGTIFFVAPIHLAALPVHLDKAFLGFLPLSLLAMNRALDPQRSGWWSTVTALAVLAALLHSGYQFVQAVFGVALFALLTPIRVGPLPWRFLLWRLTLVGAAGVVLVLPLLVLTALAGATPGISAGRNLDSLAAHPDLLFLLLPPFWTRLTGDFSFRMVQALGIERPSVETTIFLVWTGLVLMAVALRRPDRQRWHWALYLLGFVVLSLGPFLKVMGASKVTDFELPLILPYAVVASIPGLTFMRASGRFMFQGYIAFALLAAWGVALLGQRWPRARLPLVALATLLVVLEMWPRPWPQQGMPVAPPFYQQLAADPERYGVFDLPLIPKPLTLDGLRYLVTRYQAYQTVHGKGITRGDLARNYDLLSHPIFPALMTGYPARSPDVQVNGEAVNGYATAQYELARQNYRYVVLHKRLDDQASATGLLEGGFGGQAPLFEDEQTRVYAVAPLSDTAGLPLTLALGPGWYQPEGGMRWARNSAQLYIASPRAQRGWLEVAMASLFDPRAGGPQATRGLLEIEVSPGQRFQFPVTRDSTLRLPLQLSAGGQSITLRWPAGSFRPSQYGGTGESPRSFAVTSLNLSTQAGAAGPESPDLRVEGGLAIEARYGVGWYEYERQSELRWALSPAELLLFAPATERVELEILPHIMYRQADGGFGASGQLHLSLNGQTGPTIPITQGEAARVPLTLQAGWNRVTFRLADGNFRPNTGDPRLLSFTAKRITIRPATP